MSQVGRWNGVQHDQYGRPVSPQFTSVQDYLDYVASLDEPPTSPTMQEAAKVRANPGAWEIGPGGNLAQKPSWLAKNITWLGPAAVTGGALGLAALGGGAAGAAGGASGAAATTAVPSMPWTIPAGFNASMGAAPLGGLAPAAGGAAAGAAGTAGASSIGDRIKGALTSPQGIAALLASIPAGIAAFGGGGGNSMSDQEKALLDEALKRTQRTDPLHQAVTQLAYSRLPVSARQGTTLTGK